jgi:putative transposase
LRDVFDAVFYVLRSGCPWRLVPGDFPPWSTVYYHFRSFRLDGLWHRVFTVLRTAERGRFDKDPDASAAIVDSQSVKTTEEGIGSNGYDAQRTSRVESGTCWSTPWAYRSRSTSPPPTYRTGP